MNELLRVIKHSQQRIIYSNVQFSCQFSHYTSTLSFLRSMERWLINGCDYNYLPFVFHPLNRKSLNLIRAYAQHGKLQEELDDWHLESAFFKEASNGTHCGDASDITNILEGAFGYGALANSVYNFASLYAYWYATIAVLYEFLYSKVEPRSILIKGDGSYPWPRCNNPDFSNDRDMRDSAVVVELESGLLIPYSWDISTILLFDMLGFHRVGPFAKHGISVVWNLKNKVITGDEEESPVNIRDVVNPVYFPIDIDMVADSSGVRFNYYPNVATECYGIFTNGLIAALSFLELWIDFAIHRTGSVWKFLRGKGEENIRNPDVVTLNALTEFLKEYRHFAKEDGDFRRNLRGLSEEIHPKRTPIPVIEAHHGLDLELNRIKGMAFDVQRGPSRAAPSREALDLINSAKQEATALYKELRKYLKKNRQLTYGDFKTRQKKTVEHFVQHYTGRYCSPANMGEILCEDVLRQFEGNDKNLKSRTVSEILSALVLSHLKEAIPASTIRSILSQNPQ